MADLKTTQERRDRFRTWLHDDTRDHMSIRAWCVAEDACQDVDTLLAEVERLRAALFPIATGRFSSVSEACDIAEAALGAEAVAVWNAAENARAALGEP